MAILYTFRVIGADSSAAFPPSVMSSTWWQNLSTYWESVAIGQVTNICAIIFEDQTALNSYIDTYKLTDATLISDINNWKSAHGITYSSNYYNLSDANITPTPTPIIS